MQAVIETAVFLRHAKLAGVTEDERDMMKVMIASDPTQGDTMEGTGGVRKVRVSRPDSGKSGGYRLLTFYAGDEIPIFFVDIYTKGEKANWTKAERNTFAANAKTMIELYRQSAKDRAEKERKIHG